MFTVRRFCDKVHVYLVKHHFPSLPQLLRNFDKNRAAVWLGRKLLRDAKYRLGAESPEIGIFY